jgi:uncharacterized protein
MSTQSNSALIQHAYAAFGAADLQTLLGLMTPDIVWEFPASNAIPWAGTFRGPDEVARFFGALCTLSPPTIAWSSSGVNAFVSSRQV